MIDFRYHIVSIVAVLLALSAGVVLGSGLLGGPLLDDIQRRADDIRETNDELRRLAEERLERIEGQDRFAEAVGAYLLPGALDGVNVTIIEPEGISDSFRDEVTTTIGMAGGVVSGTVRLLDGLALRDDIEVDELALALGSVSGDPDELRSQLGSTLASRLSAASQVGSGGPGVQAAARGRLEELLADLEEAGFVSTEQSAQGPLVPTDTEFVVLSGTAEPAEYEIRPLLSGFVSGLAAKGATVVVGEADGSIWDIIPAVREDADTAESISTVTAADTSSGQVILALTIGAAAAGELGHHGVGSDAGAILPSPIPSPPPEE